MIGVEMRKQVRRTRTYVGFGILAVIPIIFTVAFKANPPKGPNREFLDLATASGINLTIAALTAVSAFLLIVVVALFAGETVSGEASWGTLRYLLVRPVTRNRLLATKLAVASLLAVIATILVSVIALAVGTLAFGWHAVSTPALVSVSPGSALARLALATLYVAWSQAAYVAFAFMLSTMTDNAFGAVAGGVGLGIVSQILNNIPALDRISFVFPTHYLDRWHALFLQSADTTEMIRGTILQLPYVIIPLVIAWWWFNRKDIIS